MTTVVFATDSPEGRAVLSWAVAARGQVGDGWTRLDAIALWAPILIADNWLDSPAGI